MPTPAEVIKPHVHGPGMGSVGIVPCPTELSGVKDTSPMVLDPVAPMRLHPPGQHRPPGSTSTLGTCCHKWYPTAKDPIPLPSAAVG